jgi:glycerophosphoryl diester phosphodiesterase
MGEGSPPLARRLPRLFAHRGASAERAENSIAGFERARELGAEGIEFDVRLARDGVPVILHDRTLERTTSGSGDVRDYDSAALSRLRLRDPAGSGFLAEGVPTLSALLEAVPKPTWLDVEIKADGEDSNRIVAATVEVLRSAGRQKRAFVTSFEGAIVEAARKAGMKAGLLSVGLETDAELAAVLSEADALCLWEGSCHADVAEACHGRGLPLLAWTVDDPIRASELFAMGVDAVITNDFATLRGVDGEARPPHGHRLPR